MNTPLFVCGLGIWAAATVALRVGGQYLLSPGHWLGMVLIFTVSFPLMAVLVLRLCRRFQISREHSISAAVPLAMPTLLLDPFSSALFPRVFPNMAPDMAGVFGGWMLWCCAGALAGGIWRARPNQ